MPLSKMLAKHDAAEHGLESVDHHPVPSTCSDGVSDRGGCLRPSPEMDSTLDAMTRHPGLAEAFRITCKPVPNCAILEDRSLVSMSTAD
jgi:hypothetical protein